MCFLVRSEEVCMYAPCEVWHVFNDQSKTQHALLLWSRQSPTEIKKREEFVTRLVLLFDIAMKDVELSPNTKDRRLLTMQREQAGRKGVMIGIDGKLVARSKRHMKQSRKSTAVPV